MQRPPRTPLLIALNAALAVAALAICLAPAATAQRNATRARGDYLLVSGKVQSSNANIVYVIDTANQEMLALRWNENAKRLEPLSYRNLGNDITANPGR